MVKFMAVVVIVMIVVVASAMLVGRGMLKL